MSSSHVDDLPYQPTDREIEERTREAIRSDNLPSLDAFIFDHDYLSPSWVVYIVAAEACRLAEARHASHLERIVQRAVHDMEDCPPMIEMAVGMVEDLYRKFGDREGATRLVLLRFKLHELMRARGEWEAPSL